MLQKHSKLLSLIHQAVGRKQGVVRINWEGKEMLFSPSLHVTLISKAARVLKAESMVLAQEGHVREAVQNQALAFRCADHLQSGRSVLYAIVGCGTNATTLRGMREILYLHGDDPQIAQSVLEAVRENAHTPNITSAMRADATISFFTLDYFRSINPKFVIPDATPQSGRWRLPKAPTSKEQQNAYIDASEAAILHRQRLDILASEHPYLEAKRLFAANQSEWIKSRSDRTDMANGMGDDESGYVAMAGADNASINVVEIAARLLIWKSQHGGFPSKLSAIGDTPLDPFSGKSFGYRREGSGFVLYSVGEGGNFEGGSPNVKPKASLPMFRYPVPAYYRLPANLGKTP
ncbi:MAG: hypothetical protein ABIY70_02390 [Capsulimonas sp.]|uniref:hypothetical protein n=1 Tax=Capsulimonas sp. TaxID=2494211 RepID=UPI003262F8FD